MVTCLACRDTLVLLSELKGCDSLAIHTHDGVGFQKTRPNALGILGMRERITMLDGDFSIETGDSGTTVTAIIPYPPIK